MTWERVPLWLTATQNWYASRDAYSAYAAASPARPHASEAGRVSDALGGALFLFAWLGTGEGVSRWCLVLCLGRYVRALDDITADRELTEGEERRRGAGRGSRSQVGVPKVRLGAPQPRRSG